MSDIVRRKSEECFCAIYTGVSLDELMSTYIHGAIAEQIESDQTERQSKADDCHHCAKDDDLI